MERLHDDSGFRNSVLPVAGKASFGAKGIFWSIFLRCNGFPSQFGRSYCTRYAFFGLSNPG
ncbi:hypothetical protein CHN51_01915 [Sphingorhabdus sp. YGSMI21]|nr:hypothetical protein CHN51_01915 [Sphingorhabdus sp. YGSMI21]